jgi:hypothetical protein
MRLRAKCALLLFCLAGVLGGSAQQKTEASKAAYGSSRQDSSLPRKAKPLTLDEGLAILSAALDSRHHKAFSSDCSHFVHGLYERAGFSYTYASSSDLYAGVDEFRPVTNPQPGDLAVWRGHAGIVVNPSQHSFFSLLRSGPGVDSYDSPYWRKKGRPRFFRYVKAVQGGVLSSSNQTANLTPTAFEETDEREPASEDAASAISEERSAESASSATRAANRPLSTATLPVPMVNSLHPKPDQVSAAFLQSCVESESILRGHDLFKSDQPLVVFDHFAVRKVHISGSQNWVEVEINEVGSLASGNADTQKHTERQRWPLIRRGQASWELVISRNTYLPQAIAVRLMAQELAQCTEGNPATSSAIHENAELARLLDLLLRK